MDGWVAAVFRHSTLAHSPIFLLKSSIFRGNFCSSRAPLFLLPFFTIHLSLVSGECVKHKETESFAIVIPTRIGADCVLYIHIHKHNSLHTSTEQTARVLLSSHRTLTTTPFFIDFIYRPSRILVRS